ncbi:MAG: hypothetical protein KI792_09280 [Alphaproteobacteria bacterium]|nr:hypothetical protein [Alphaproteobacteria bacterium SS10]
MSTPLDDRPDGDPPKPDDATPAIGANLARWRAQGGGDTDPIPNMEAIIAAAQEMQPYSSQRTTKVAAVLFDIRTGEILGKAANSFASGIHMTDDEMRADRDRKDKNIAHAEETVLDDFMRRVNNGETPPVPTKYLGVYATHSSCPRCARKISRTGISTFVSTTSSLDVDDRFARNWAVDIMDGKEILDKREEDLGGPVDVRLVTVDPDPELAAKGKFKWADPRTDHFKPVEEQAARLKAGDAEYQPPKPQIGPPANSDDPGGPDQAPRRKIP